MRIRSWLGPWPLRPLWQFILIATVQNFGINEGGLFTQFANELSRFDPSLVGVGFTRFGFAVLLSAVVVGVQWAVSALTTRGQEQPSIVAFLAMAALGAVAAALLVVAVQAIDGRGLLLPLFLGSFFHYFFLLVIIQTSIGVIGSRMSASAARAEDALEKLSAQERRFVASEERARRIAAEFLHDRVQADLLVIAIELRRVGESAPPEIASQIASITEVVESVRVSEVRDTSRLLSPLVQSAGLSSALATLAQRWRDVMQVSLDIEQGIDADSPVSTEGDPEAGNRALGIYRIVEQALLNAAAHGHARQVQVSVTCQSRDGREWIRVYVADDGVGFDSANSVDGGGFAISQVWARLLDGAWEVHSQPGRGTTVTAWLPA